MSEHYITVQKNGKRRWRPFTGGEKVLLRRPGVKEAERGIFLRRAHGAKGYVCINALERLERFEPYQVRRVRGETA